MTKEGMKISKRKLLLLH